MDLKEKSIFSCFATFFEQTLCMKRNRIQIITWNSHFVVRLLLLIDRHFNFDRFKKK